MVNTEIRNATYQFSEAKKKSEMVENEDRKLFFEGLTCDLRLKKERTLQRFRPTTFLA